MKICLVDDSKFQIQQITKIIKKLGHEVESYSNAVNALENLKANTYDCLITDLYMPELNGEELIKKVKVLHPNMNIIVVSATFQDSEETKCLELGVKSCLVKPISLDMIRQSLEK